MDGIIGKMESFVMDRVGIIQDEETKAPGEGRDLTMKYWKLYESLKSKLNDEGKKELLELDTTKNDIEYFLMKVSYFQGMFDGHRICNKRIID